MSGLRVAVVVGNPKPLSRTWEAANRVAAAIDSARPWSLDLASLGPALLDWEAADVAAAVAAVADSDIVVVATPTFKATYTGLLKLFLDRFAGGTGLEGVVAVPLQLGSTMAHALSPELHLRPLLAELGAIVPAPALYLLDSVAAPDPVEQRWVARWAPTLRRSAGQAARQAL
jgi:FMN reductase